MQTKRNSHTTSTKCQYQAAASKPKCRCGVKPPLMARIRQTSRKVVPTMHVEAVEAGGEEEDRGIDAAGEVERRLGILDRLEGAEADAEQHGQRQAGDQPLAVAMQQRVVRPGHRAARQQQDHGVQEGQAEGVEGQHALRRPDRGRGAGDMLRVEREVEIGPEEGDEEHDLGGDEQRHAVAQADPHHRGVQAGRPRLDEDVAPPEEHGRQHAGDAEVEHPVDAVMRQQDDAEHQGAAGEGADDRPGRGIHQVVGMLVQRGGLRRRCQWCWPCLVLVRSLRRSPERTCRRVCASIPKTPP